MCHEQMHAGKQLRRLRRKKCSHQDLFRIRPGRGGDRRQERKVTAQTRHRGQKDVEKLIWGVRRDGRRSKRGREFTV